MARDREITTADLRNWKLLERFVKVLQPVVDKSRLHPSFADPRRTLDHASYLSLFLFGLFNPVVESMRQLCAISHLEKVQQTTGGAKVSLGSFSETQRLLDPDLLKQVFEQLAEQAPRDAAIDPRLKHLDLIAQDGSLWRALPSMAWAEYGVGSKGNAKGVRLHLRFNLLKEAPEDALITQGNGSETAALREMLLPGQTTVGDRLYGQSYKLFQQVDQARAFFVFRINEQALIHWEEELPISDAAAQAGVVRHGWVHLGATEKLRSMRLRLVEIQHQGQRLLLVTNHPVEMLSAELVGLVYRRRWSIELYFRWIKCILGTRRFFAQSPEGVAIQLYLALIAGLLLQLFTGQRPNKRVMEFLQYYFMGWASEEETARLIARYSTKAKPAKKS